MSSSKQLHLPSHLLAQASLGLGQLPWGTVVKDTPSPLLGELREGGEPQGPGTRCRGLAPWGGLHLSWSCLSWDALGFLGDSDGGSLAWVGDPCFPGPPQPWVSVVHSADSDEFPHPRWPLTTVDTPAHAPL